MRITTAQAVRLTMYTEARLRQLAAEGCFPKAVRGEYEFLPLIHGILRHLNARQERAEARSNAPLAQAKQREIELRVEQQLAQLIDVEDVVSSYKTIRGAIQEELDAAAFDAPSSLKAKVKAAQRAAFRRMDSRFAQALAALKAGLDPLEAVHPSKSGMKPHD